MAVAKLPAVRSGGFFSLQDQGRLDVASGIWKDKCNSPDMNEESQVLSARLGRGAMQK